MKGKAKRWTVYGIYVAEELRYIGMAANLSERRQDHEVKLFAFQRFEMRPISVHRLRTAALAAERKLIRRHKPPVNRQYLSLGRGGYLLVKTCRPRFDGRMVCVTARLRPDQMPVEEARKEWFADLDELDVEALDRMRGWRIGQALNVFGPRSRKS